MWIALAVVGGVGTGLYFGHHWVTQSERFAVSDIEVRGGETVRQDEIAQHLDAVRGQNIFATDPATLSAQLEAHPWIASASVRRRLPSRLVIELVERETAAVVDLGGLYLLDQELDVFKRAALDHGEGADKPIITGLARELYLSEPDVAKAHIAEALELSELYLKNPSRPELGEIHIDLRTGFTLRTYDRGAAIRIGRGEKNSFAARLKIFDATWAALDGSEQDRASIIRIDNAARPDRATVAFVASR